MRVLVVGGTGMLGTDVIEHLTAQGHEVLAPNSSDLDITDPASVAQIPAGSFGRLDWCVNCSAYTAVDKAETEIREATELNTLGPGYLARACATEGCRLIHLSTDFVFDGNSAEPYGEDAPTNPIQVYGRTKREGEAAVLEAHSNALVVRTSWLYGPSGNSFPRTMIRAWEAERQLRVVADQTGCPTYTRHLAETLSGLIGRNAFPGIYHASGPDALTWYDFATLTLTTWKETRRSDREVLIEPIKAEQWPTPAKRPPYSVLSNDKIHTLDLPPMPPVETAVRDFCSRLSL
jgi:dTDP-4-dehydrorhamnose reductase